MGIETLWSRMGPIWKAAIIVALSVVGLESCRRSSRSSPGGFLRGSPASPNLESLEEIDLPSSVKSLRGLPDHIRVLRAPDSGIKSLKGVPKSVEELDVSYTKGIKSLDWIPRNLKALDIRETEIHQLVGFPPGLESLKVASQKIYRLGKLPESLLDLYLENTQIHDLDGLPLHLRTLYVAGESFDNLDNLPRTLQSLTLVATNVKSLKNLPPSLQVLRLSANHRLHFKAEDLPPLLNGFEADLDQPFPDLSGLKYLSWYSDRRQRPSPSFPRFLSSLTLRTPGWAEFPNFPSSLRALGLLSANKVPLDKLPSELEILKLTGFLDPKITSLKGLGRLKALQLETSSLSELPALPDALERLFLTGTSINNLKGLPPYLKELEFCSSGLTELDGRRDLPSSLVSLNLCGSRSLKRIVSVPERLAHLNVSNTEIGELPPFGAHLATLDISNTKIAIAQHLPSSLISLTVSEGQIQRWSDIPSHVKAIHFVKKTEP